MATSEGQLKTYEQLCMSYRAIDDFRAKLLALLPLATGGGIFFLLQPLEPETKAHLLPIGTFGFVVTLGLFLYEIYGVKKCHCLIFEGRKIEEELDLKGQFRRRPREVAKFINEPFAAGLIYPAVLAAWTVVALVYTELIEAAPDLLFWIPILVFIVGLGGSLGYNIYLRKTDPSGLCKIEQI